MYKILVLSHGDLSRGIVDAGKMILGDVSGVSYLSLDEEGIEKFTTNLKLKVEELSSECKDILILSDLFGGTPFNKSLEDQMKNDNIKIISGVNLPMFIEALININSDLEDMYDTILASGSVGIKSGQITAKSLDDE